MGNVGASAPVDLRKMLAKAEEQSRLINAKLDQMSVEWVSARNILDEDFRKMRHDQASLRTVLLAILDELDAADRAAAKAAKR